MVISLNFSIYFDILRMSLLPIRRENKDSLGIILLIFKKKKYCDPH